MIRVKIFATFCSSERARELFCKGLQEYRYKNIYFVIDDFYTHIVLINNASPQVNVNKDRVIGLSFEPLAIIKREYLQEYFLQYCAKQVSQILIGDNQGLPIDLFKKAYCYQWHVPYEVPPEKTRIMSLILSTKKSMTGHKYRHSLVQRILESDRDIHIYGHGSIFYNDSRIKGSFTDGSPYIPYYFSIAIENTCEDYYISEKFTNCLCYNTVPIYLGAPRIDEIFGRGCCIKLSGSIERDLQLIYEIYDDPQRYLLDLTSARHELSAGRAYFPEFIHQLWKS